MSTEINIIHLKSVDSTNSYALRLAREGAPHGTVVWADEQSGGRGKFDRKWYSEPGKDLLASIIVRPKRRPRDIAKITLEAAEVVKAELEGTYGLKGLDLVIKPPNDLNLRGRKVCGILTESSSKGETLEFAVIGIGVNLNSDPGQELANSTSFYRELSRNVEISEVLSRISDSMVKIVI